MFVITKIALYFLHPVVWIIVIFLWALFSNNQKRKRNLYKTGILLLIFFTNPFIIRKLVLSYQEKAYEPAQGENYSAGILLGGLSGYDRKNQKPYFSESSDRFIQTVRLYKTGHIKSILISGGSGSIFQKSFREADFLRDQLLQVGIPDSSIFIERNSRNTVENAMYSKKILDSLHMQGPFLLITSAMHLPRAKRIFEKQGINVQPYACAFTVHESGDNFFDDTIFPRADAMELWFFYLREIASLFTWKISGKA